MILVDYRRGSHELIAPLRALGLSVEKVTLPFGDLAFEGRGEKSKPVDIGIEFKQLSEFVTAMRTQRLQGFQMKGMRDLYDYSYLFIEGVLRYDSINRLLKRQRKTLVLMHGQMTAQELLQRKNTLHLCGGLNPTWTTCRKDTLQELLALYRTWTDQDLDKHKSHLAIYEAPPLTLVEPGAAAKTAHIVQGIGWRKAKEVARVFKTPAGVCAATLQDWMGIDGIGAELARRAVSTLQGG